MQTNIPTRISLSFPRYGPGIRLDSTVLRLPYNCLSNGVDFSLNTGEGVSQVKLSTVADYTDFDDFQTFNNLGSCQPAKGPRKISFTFYF